MCHSSYGSERGFRHNGIIVKLGTIALSSYDVLSCRLVVLCIHAIEILLVHEIVVNVD